MLFWISVVGINIYLVIGGYLAGMNTAEDNENGKLVIFGFSLMVTFLWLPILCFMALKEFVFEPSVEWWKHFKFTNPFKGWGRKIKYKIKGMFTETDPFDETDNEVDEDRLKRMGLDTRTDVWTSELETSKNDEWE